MTVGQIVYYDFDHCRKFIEDRARELKETSKGLEALALYRELFYSFSYETLENSSLTLGQFDTGTVYVFVPATLLPSEYPQGHEVVRSKAVGLMGCDQPPVVLDLLSAQTTEPLVGPPGKIESWMRPEFLQDVILSGKVQIQLYFDAGGLYKDIIAPQMVDRGFTLLEDYVTAARSGVIRVKHPAAPGKIYKLPWMAWIREMMGGGYSVVYVLACMATYLQRLETALSKTS